ncbi:hypothetical protein IAU60_004891 [Kwoniella sp. DSM 27419]
MGDRSDVVKKRASKACSRCRRFRTKCVPLRPNQVGQPPCSSCVSLGVGAECTFLPRGHSAVDRAPTSPNSSPLTDLPPPNEVVEAIRNYVSSYFQLGFLHKALFVERYLSRSETISRFLLLAICSIAAPFTPSLVERYGGKKRATEYFLSRADDVLGREMTQPSLERAQGFLLLGVAEWGQGNGPKAWVGTAVRMAGFLGLHRESTYQLPLDPTPEAFIESEVASVTCHENLLAGQSRPMQISLTEVDVLLPCEESEFNFGIPPQTRASIAGILSGASGTFDVPNQGDKSLFASFSMAGAIDPEGAVESLYDSRDFWLRMADEMIVNSQQLLSQVETFFGMRSVQLGFPPIMVFGVYMCGNVFSYLCRWPEPSYGQCIEILAQLADSWPLASRWHDALRSSAHHPIRQMGYTRIRTAVQDERTLDDDMADIYGRPTGSIVASSPDDRISVPSNPPTAARSSSQAIPTVPLPQHVNQTDTLNLDFAPGNEGMLAGPGDDETANFFMDTFGEDLSAFLQSAVPVPSSREGDDGFGQVFW